MFSFQHHLFNWSGLQTQSGVPRAPSAGWWLSLPYLVSNSSDLQLHRESRRPLLLGSGFPYHILSPTLWSLTHWLPVFTELYNSSITHSISLEWHVWSSSSGHNCHAVHRSLSSGASVNECTMGFLPSPIFSAKSAYAIYLITAIGMCHLLPVHHFGVACLAGSKVNIQQFCVCLLSILHCVL